MTTGTTVIMVLICGFVWGGFAALLIRAMLKEGAKKSGRIDEHPPHPSP